MSPKHLWLKEIIQFTVQAKLDFHNKTNFYENYLVILTIKIFRSMF